MREVCLLFFSVLSNLAKEPFNKYLFVWICVWANVFLFGADRLSSSFSYETMDWW